MKNKIITSIILVLIVSWLAILIFYKFNWEKKLSQTPISDITINTTSEKLEIEPLLKLLATEENVIKSLEEWKNWNYLEDLPRLKTYYQENANWSFYLESAIYNHKEENCNEITTQKEKDFCNSVLKNIENVNIIKENLKNFWIEDQQEIEEVISFFQKLYKKEDCKDLSIIRYLSCKKIQNKEFDVEKYFIKYSVLENSDLNIVENNVERIIKHWNLDEDFITTVKLMLKKSS